MSGSLGGRSRWDLWDTVGELRRVKDKEIAFICVQGMRCEGVGEGY